MTTYCPQRHEYSNENTYIDKKGYKHCRTCSRESTRKLRELAERKGNANLRKTHCPQRHEYTKENTYINPQGRRWCRACMRANSKIQNVKVHHITVEERDKLLTQQDGKCGICQVKFTDDMQKCIDHDHSCCPGLYSCGECIRGILCVDCNVALGRFKDSIENLQSAITYLKSYKKLEAII